MIIDEIQIFSTLKEIAVAHSYDRVYSNQDELLRLYTWMVDHELVTAVEKAFITDKFPNNSSPRFNRLEASLSGGSFYIHLYLLKETDKKPQHDNLIAQYKIRLSDHKGNDTPQKSMEKFVGNPFRNPEEANQKDYFTPNGENHHGAVNREIQMNMQSNPRDLGAMLVAAFTDAAKYFELRLKQFQGEELGEDGIKQLEKLFRMNRGTDLSQTQLNNDARTKRLTTKYADSPYFLSFGVTDKPKGFNMPRVIDRPSMTHGVNIMRDSITQSIERMEGVLSELISKRGVKMVKSKNGQKLLESYREKEAQRKSRLKDSIEKIKLKRESNKNEQRKFSDS